MGDEHCCLAKGKEIPEAQRKELRSKFKKMMATLYKEEGASLRVEVLKEESVLDFIGTHADILDSTFSQTKMSDTLRQSLQRSNWIFSGMKTFHELHEAFPSLLDEEGKRKPFERFLKDVQRVDETYNKHYLRAEYNFATASAQAAAQWEQIEADADRYHLQYRTAGDNRVRDEHQKLEGITLPPSNSFWDTYYPPNGWNCRCRAVQVRKSKYPSTPSHEVIQRVTAHEAQQKGNKRDMFRFNSGKQKKVWPDYNPYTIRNCSSCPLAQGKGKMAWNDIPHNEMCQGCALLRKCETMRYKEVKHYDNGGRILQHELVKETDSDFPKLMEVAEFFAQEGKEVKLTPKLDRFSKFVYENIYHSLIGTRYEGKCPDLLVDDNWYEHEGFTTTNPKNAFRNMVGHGLKQSSRIIIDRPEVTERYMSRILHQRVKDGALIDEVWIREVNGSLALLYKKTDG